MEIFSISFNWTTTFCASVVYIWCEHWIAYIVVKISRTIRFEFVCRITRTDEWRTQRVLGCVIRSSGWFCERLRLSARAIALDGCNSTWIISDVLTTMVAYWNCFFLSLFPAYIYIIFAMAVVIVVVIDVLFVRGFVPFWDEFHRFNKYHFLSSLRFSLFFIFEWRQKPNFEHFTILTKMCYYLNFSILPAKCIDWLIRIDLVANVNNAALKPSIFIARDVYLSEMYSNLFTKEEEYLSGWNWHWFGLRK